MALVHVACALVLPQLDQATRVLSPARRTGGGLEDVTNISEAQREFVSFRLFLSVHRGTCGDKKYSRIPVSTMILEDHSQQGDEHRATVCRQDSR